MILAAWQWISLNDPFNGILYILQDPLNDQADYLNLDQIRMLPDNLLMHLFTESVADQKWDTFTYQCHLMSGTCKQTFSSHGNETKACQQMKGHLLSHIASLLAEASCKFIFIV